MNNDLAMQPASLLYQASSTVSYILS